MSETKTEVKYFQKKGFFFNCKLKSTDADKLLYTTTGKSHERLVLPVTDGVSEERVEVFTYGQQDDVYYSNAKNEFVSVAWADRNKPEIIKDSAYKSKLQVNFGKKETYISPYDFIKSICEHLRSGKLNDRVLRLTGDIEYKLYNGEVQRTLNLKSIGFAADDVIEMDFKVVMSAVYKKDGLTYDDANKKLVLHGFVQEYVKLDGESNKLGRMFPQDFVIDYTKHTKSPDLLKNLYVSNLDVKDDKCHAILFEAELFKGVKNVKVNPLTDEQKLYIELGLLSEEEALKDNEVKDDHVLSEVRVIRPSIKNPPYTRTTFIPDNHDKFVFGFDVVKDEMFDNNDDTSSDDLFGTSKVSDDDLDSLFN